MIHVIRDHHQDAGFTCYCPENDGRRGTLRLEAVDYAQRAPCVAFQCRIYHTEDIKPGTVRDRFTNSVSVNRTVAGKQFEFSYLLVGRQQVAFHPISQQPRPLDMNAIMMMVTIAATAVCTLCFTIRLRVR